MARKREKPEDIVMKLRQVEVLQGQGMSTADAVRQIGVTQQTYYRWRRQYGGMSRDQLKRLKELEKENQRLRKAVSDLTLDKMILTEAARVWIGSELALLPFPLQASVVAAFSRQSRGPYRRRSRPRAASALRSIFQGLLFHPG